MPSFTHIRYVLTIVQVAERIYQNIEAGKYDLNDRRSGVKGANAGGAGNTAKTINLSVADGGSKKQAGGCC